jgi:hypothetical protein
LNINREESKVRYYVFDTVSIIKSITLIPLAK